MHLEILKKSIDYLVNDGKYDRQELEDLLALALEDNEVNDDEKRVLKDIFNTALIAGVDDDTLKWIKLTSVKYGL